MLWAQSSSIQQRRLIKYSAYRTIIKYTARKSHHAYSIQDPHQIYSKEDLEQVYSMEGSPSVQQGRPSPSVTWRLTKYTARKNRQVYSKEDFHKYTSNTTLTGSLYNKEDWSSVRQDRPSPSIQQGRLNKYTARKIHQVYIKEDSPCLKKGDSTYIIFICSNIVRGCTRYPSNGNVKHLHHHISSNEALPGISATHLFLSWDSHTHISQTKFGENVTRRLSLDFLKAPGAVFVWNTLYKKGSLKGNHDYILHTRKYKSICPIRCFQCIMIKKKKVVNRHMTLTTFVQCTAAVSRTQAFHIKTAFVRFFLFDTNVL